MFKELFKKLFSWVVIWIWFILTILVTWYAYWALVNVNSWNPLTADLWNNLTNQVNSNTLTSVKNTKFSFSNVTPYWVTAWSTLPLYPNNADISTNWNNIILKWWKIYSIDLSWRIDWSDWQSLEYVTYDINKASDNTTLETYLVQAWDFYWWDSYWTSNLYMFPVDTEIYVKVHSQSSNPAELQNGATYLSVSEISFWN